MADDKLLIGHPAPRVFRYKGLETEVNTGAGREIRKSLLKDDNGDPVLTPLLINALGSLIIEGCTLANASRVCGLRITLLEKWLIKGRTDIEGNPPKRTDEAKLAREIESALGDQEYELSKIVMAKAQTDPKLGLEVLARRNPAHWERALPEAVDASKVYSGMSKADAIAEIRRLSKDITDE